MVWVIVFGGIALAGLVMLISYAVWLAHKASDVWSEVDMLAVRANELAELVDRSRFQTVASGRTGPAIAPQILRSLAQSR